MTENILTEFLNCTAHIISYHITYIYLGATQPMFKSSCTVYILYYVYILMFRSSAYCIDVRLSCHNKRILLLLLLFFIPSVVKIPRVKFRQFQMK